MDPPHATAPGNGEIAMDVHHTASVGQRLTFTVVAADSPSTVVVPR